MRGRIDSGQLCTVAPVDPASLVVGDSVLCRVRGNDYLHIVKAIPGHTLSDRQQSRADQRLGGRRLHLRQMRADRGLSTL
jgi:hypothetical protein